MDTVRNRVYFDHSVIMESMNRSGGMALFWKQEVNVIEIHKTAFIIEAHIVDHNQQTDWWLIGSYARCDAAIRKNKWKVRSARKRS